MAKNETMTTQQVAAELEVSITTVSRMVKRGVLAPRAVSPHLLRPKAYVFDRAEVERYKSANS